MTRRKARTRPISIILDCWRNPLRPIAHAPPHELIKVGPFFVIFGILSHSATVLSIDDSGRNDSRRIPHFGLSSVFVGTNNPTALEAAIMLRGAWSIQVVLYQFNSPGSCLTRILHLQPRSQTVPLQHHLASEAHEMEAPLGVSLHTRQHLRTVLCKPLQTRTTQLHKCMGK